MRRIDLTVNTVRMFHRTKVIAPRESGPPEMSIDVPEVSQTHLDQTVKNWPLGQTLLITGGIHPGILDKKGGWLGTPIGAPSSTEVLVFLDAETVGPRQAQGDGADDPRQGRRRGRPRTTRRSTRPAIPRPAPARGQAVDPRARPRFRAAATEPASGSPCQALIMSEQPRRGNARPTDLASRPATVYNGWFGSCATSPGEAPRTCRLPVPVPRLPPPPGKASSRPSAAPTSRWRSCSA